MAETAIRAEVDARGAAEGRSPLDKPPERGLDPAALTQACATQLSHRLPLLYAVLLFDVGVLAASFASLAPRWLTFWLPLPAIAVVVWRAIYWLPTFVQRRGIAMLERDVARLPRLGTLSAVLPMCWALALYGYGGREQQSLIHYITAVTCFTAVLGLGQSPRTAVRMAMVVMLPTSAFFLMHDHPNRYMIVAVQAVVTVLVLLVAAGYNRDFLRLEMSRQEIERRKHESDALAAENRLMADCDVLTGAHNRRRILAIFEEMIAAPDIPDPWLALLDLDGFKAINDTYGHAAGDAVLRAVSDRIGAAHCIEAFGRMGGDEFALLLPGELTPREVRTALDMLGRAVCEPIPVDALRLLVRASIGVHRCQGEDPGESLERADAALYRAKEEQAGGISIFSAMDEDDLHKRRALMRAFTSANLGEQLGLAYQPIVDGESGMPVAFEALVRWSPDGVIWLPPSEFIDLAERTGRIGQLTEHVLGKALAERRAFGFDGRIAVNLSARDILRENIADRIGGLVRAAGATAASMTLEITESALISDYQRAARNLQALREQGFLIALDDFGTGQSSLSHVHNLPLDQIKIDRSFAQDIAGSQAARAVVATILAMSRQLGLECTIEGIETDEQRVVARALGVRMMQGYLFGRPARAEQAFAAAGQDRHLA